MRWNLIGLIVGLLSLLFQLWFWHLQVFSGVHQLHSCSLWLHPPASLTHRSHTITAALLEGTHTYTHTQLISYCEYYVRIMSWFLFLDPSSQTLQLLFELMLSSSFDMDLIGPAADATYALICCQQVRMYTLFNFSIINPWSYASEGYCNHPVYLLIHKSNRSEGLNTLCSLFYTCYWKLTLKYVAL